jgi:hypothetical protein
MKWSWLTRHLNRSTRVKRESAEPIATHGTWPLSRRLMSWNAQDHFTLADAVCGIQAFGATGSAKSTGSMAAILDAYMSNGMGMLLLCVKPDDPESYLRRARENGREADVVMIGPNHPTTYNFIEDEVSGPSGGAGMVSNLTSLISIVSSMALGSSGQSGGREDGSFWQKMDNRLISSCAELLVHAVEPVTTMNLERLVLGIPNSRDEIDDPRWQSRSYVYHCLRQAEAKGVDSATAEDRADLARLADYFLLDLARLSEKTRSTVQSSVGSTLDLFNRQIVRRLLSSANPNFRMSMLQEGKILVVDMSVMMYRDVARLTQMTLKYCFQLAQNRRDVTANPRPVALVCDESQLLIDLEHDAAFQTTARATRTCTVYCTQSISNYLSEHSGSSVESRVHALLSNLQTQLFHQTTDTKTVEYAQALFGKRIRLLMQSNTQRQNDDWASHAMGIGGSSGVSAGYSEHLDHLVQAGDFHALLRGGPPHWTSEALLYSSGRTFAATGKSVMPVRFAQQPNSL